MLTCIRDDAIAFLVQIVRKAIRSNMEGWTDEVRMRKEYILEVPRNSLSEQKILRNEFKSAHMRVETQN